MAVAWAVVLAAWGPAVGERGAPVSVRMTVESSGCLEVDDLTRRIEAESSEALQADVLVDVFDDSDGHVRLSLRAGDTRSERSLDLSAESCEERRATVALSLALALEFFVAGQRASALSEPAPEPEPEPRPKPEPEPKLEPEPEPEVSRETPTSSRPVAPKRPGWALGIGPVVHSGVVLHVGVGGSVRVEHAWRSVAVRIATQWVVADRIALPPGRMRVHEIVAVPEVCPRWSFDRVALAACGGARVGLLLARGLDFARPRRNARPWVAPSAAAEVRAGLSHRLALSVAAFLAVPILRPRFVAGDATLSGAPVVGGGSVELTLLLGSR